MGRLRWRTREYQSTPVAKSNSKMARLRKGWHELFAYEGSRPPTALQWWKSSSKYYTPESRKRPLGEFYAQWNRSAGQVGSGERGKKIIRYLNTTVLWPNFLVQGNMTKRHSSSPSPLCRNSVVAPVIGLDWSTASPNHQAYLTKAYLATFFADRIKGKLGYWHTTGSIPSLKAQTILEI